VESAEEAESVSDEHEILGPQQERESACACASWTREWERRE
jgi:hypothetical protein